MAGERIASGEVFIEVNDRDALARLEEIRRGYHDTMAALDRESATMEIKGDASDLEKAAKKAREEIKRLENDSATIELRGDLGKLDDAVANAKRKIRQLQGEKAEVEIGVRKGDPEKYDAKIEEARLALKSLDGMRAEVEVEVKGADQAIREQRRIAKEAEDQQKKLDKIQSDRAAAEAKRLRDEAALAKRIMQQRAAEERKLENEQRARERAADQAEKARLKAVKDRAKTMSSLERQRAAEETARARAIAAEEKRLENDARARERAAAQSEKARLQDVRDRSRTMMALERQRATEIAQIKRAHGEALAMNKDLSYGYHSQQRNVVQLQREYARLSDRRERLAKRNAFGTEAKAKLELDKKDAFLQMEIVKRKLNLMGEHPPVEIKTTLGRKGMSRLTGPLRDVGSAIGNALGKLPDTSVRLGPFTASIRGLIASLALLGPSITDVVGSLGALIGVAGAGLAGAAAVGAGGITGMGISFLGLKFATRNTGQEIAQARQSINALSAATLKYGPNSDKTKKKQQELNSVLRQISPLAKESALGIEAFYKAWDHNTGPTQSHLGSIAKGFFGSLKAITPMWANQTNNLAKILDTNLKGGFAFLRGPEFANNFKQIGTNFNTAVTPLLHAAGSLGRAFLNFGREGSKYLDPAARAIDRLAGRLLSFTQRDDFGKTIKRWATYAGDIMHLFGALTNVVMHFFGLGSKAGDDMVNTMTNALNRWDKQITGSGKKNVQDFFANSVKGAEELYNAFKPIVQLFALWAVGLEPAVSVITQIFAAITNGGAALGRLVGLGNPLKTLGATMGALWAVSKIGTFVAMLSRIPGVLAAIGAESGALGVFKSLFNGKFLSGLKGGGGVGAQIEAASAAGAAEYRAAILGASTAGAAEMRAAMMGGGAAGGAENVAGDLLGGGLGRRKVILPPGAAREAEQAAKGVAKVGAAAAGAEVAVDGAAVASGGLTAALAGISGATALATGGIALVGAAAVIAAIHFARHKSDADKLKDSLKGINETSVDTNKTSGALLDVMNASGDAMHSYHDSINNVVKLKKHLNDLEAHGQKNTSAYKDTLATLNDALRTRATNEQQVNKLFGISSKLQQRHTAELGNQKRAQSALTTAQQQYNDAQKAVAAASHMSGNAGVAARAVAANNLTAAEKRLADAHKTAAAANAAEDVAARRAALGMMNYQRGVAGLIPIAGRAATAILNLQKHAPNLAAKISLKYADPKDAGAVAGRANAALKAGVSSKIVLKIIADSASAADAIRKLQAARLTPKKLEVIAQGGPEALSMLRKLIGTKLATKVMHILGSAADAHTKIKALIAMGIPPKTAHILGNNSDALRKAAQANSTQMRTLIQAINRVVHHDPNENTPPPTLSQTINRFIKNIGGKGKAVGRGPGASETAWVGEGHNWKGATEYIADHATGQVMRVDQPTQMDLKPSHAVIPTEPRYKGVGQRLWADFAKRFGLDSSLPAFRKGKKPKNPHLSDHGKAKARSGARTTLKSKIKPRTYVSDDNDQLPKVEAAQRAESNLRDQIQREQSQTDAMEPQTFLTQTGTDPQTGSPIYAINYDAMKRWQDRLEFMAGRFDELKNAIQHTLDMVVAAINKIGNPYADGNPINTVIGRTDANISTLNKLMEHERGIINKPKVSNVEKDKAKERLGVYKDALDTEKGTRSAATTDWKSLDAERNDIGDLTRGRMSEAIDAAATYRADEGKLGDTATTQLTDANPKPDFVPPPGPFDAGNAALQALGAESALSAIGQGLNGQPPRTSDQINADIVSQNQGIITTAQGMLSDNNPGNDAAAYDAISNAAGAIGGITNNAATGAPMAQQFSAFSSARQELFNSMGSNFMGAGAIGATNAAFKSFGPPLGIPAGVMGGQGAAGGAGQTTNVTVNNSFPTPPADPHTFSQGLKFELQATM